MNYRWQWVSGGRVVFVSDNGTVGATINRLGPYAGTPKAKFAVTGPVMTHLQHYDSVEEAMTAVEDIVGCHWPHGQQTPPSAISPLTPLIAVTKLPPL